MTPTVCRQPVRLGQTYFEKPGRTNAETSKPDSWRGMQSKEETSKRSGKFLQEAVLPKVPRISRSESVRMDDSCYQPPRQGIPEKTPEIGGQPWR